MKNIEKPRLGKRALNRLLTYVEYELEEEGKLPLAELINTAWQAIAEEPRAS